MKLDKDYLLFGSALLAISGGLAYHAFFQPKQEVELGSWKTQATIESTHQPLDERVNTDDHVVLPARIPFGIEQEPKALEYEWLHLHREEEGMQENLYLLLQNNEVLYDYRESQGKTSFSTPSVPFRALKPPVSLNDLLNRNYVKPEKGAEYLFGLGDHHSGEALFATVVEYESLLLDPKVVSERMESNGPEYIKEIGSYNK